MQSQNVMRARMPESIASTINGHTSDIADLVADALTHLKLDGSRIMDDNAFVRFGPSDLRIYNSTGKNLTFLRGPTLIDDVVIRVSQFLGNITKFTYARGRFNDSYVQTRESNDQKLHFQSYTGGTYLTVADMLAGYFDILLGGDITLIAAKTLDLRTYNAALRLPRATAAQTTGSVRYDATTDALTIYDGAAWQIH